MRHEQRHRAREAALQILYQAEVGRTDVALAATTFFDRQWAGPRPPSDELRQFATELAHETIRRLPAIDALIEKSEAEINYEENVKQVKAIQLQCLKAWSPSNLLLTVYSDTFLSGRVQNFEVTQVRPVFWLDMWLKTA